MATKDPRVDAYIAESADFAKPILRHLRKLVHKGCPDVEETMKWSFPHFMHKGMLCSMASFTNHCAFGFWKWSLLFGDNAAGEEAMGHFGRISKLSELPSDKTVIGYVKKAAQLNEKGINKPAPKRSKEKKELEVPDDLMAALRKNKKALRTFEGFSNSHKKEYVGWITEAKREETRQQRLKTALEWMAEGKTKNWKYC